MFERYTQAARKVMVEAQIAADALGHSYVGTEHLLIGLLLSEDTTGARALSGAGVTHDAVLAQVKKIVGTGNGLDSKVPFSSRAKKVLDLGWRPR